MPPDILVIIVYRKLRENASLSPNADAFLEALHHCILIIWEFLTVPKSSICLPNDPQHLENYVRRAIKNRQRNESLRSNNASRFKNQGGVHLPLTTPPNTQSEKEDLRASVQQAIGTLGRRAALVVDLRYFQEMSNQAIAAKLGMSVSNVSATLHYALKKLRKSPTLRRFSPSKTCHGGPDDRFR